MLNEGQKLAYEKLMDFVEDPNTRFIGLVGKPGCVDKDTEFLSQSGWKKISEYSKGDLVMQVSETFEGTLVEPLAYIKEKCDSFYHFETIRGIDQMLSEDHNIAYVTNKVKTLRKMSLTDFMNKSFKDDTRVKTCYSYEGKSLELSEDEIRLGVAIKADASLATESTGRYVFRLKRERKIERLKTLLNRMGREFKEKFEDSTGFTIITIYSSHTKSYKDWMFCSKKDAEIILDEYKYWDGEYDPKGNRLSRIEFKNKVDADCFQYFRNICGYRATVNEVVRDREWTVGDTTYSYKGIVIYQVLSNSQTAIALTPLNKGTREYLLPTIKPSEDGYKYCFTVPSGYLLLRRNGKVFITGNSGKSFTLAQVYKDLDQDVRDRIHFTATTNKAAMELQSAILSIMPDAREKAIRDLYERKEKEAGIEKKVEDLESSFAAILRAKGLDPAALGFIDDDVSRNTKKKRVSKADKDHLPSKKEVDQASRIVTTIYKKLGLVVGAGITKKGKTEVVNSQLHATDFNVKLPNDAIVVIDESSFIDEELLSYILEESERGVKFIFVGDQNQLTPIKSTSTPAYDLDMEILELSQVMRQRDPDSQIISYSEELKKVIIGEREDIPPMPDCSDIVPLEQTEFIDKMIEIHKANSELDGDDPEYASKRNDFKVLCYTNKKVIAYNALIKTGDKSGLDVLMKGDMATVNTRTDEFFTDELVEVIRVGDVYKKEIKFKYRDIKTREENVKDFGIIEGRDVSVSNGLVTRSYFIPVLGVDAKNITKLDVQLKTGVADIRPTHSLTVHKSQGGSYDTVFIDLSTFYCKDKIALARLLYVAITRAKTRVYYTGNLPYQ